MLDSAEASEGFDSFSSPVRRITEGALTFALGYPEYFFEPTASSDARAAFLSKYAAGAFVSDADLAIVLDSAEASEGFDSFSVLSS